MLTGSSNGMDNMKGTPKYNFKLLQTIDLLLMQGMGLGHNNYKQLLKFDIPNKFKMVNDSIYRTVSLDNWNEYKWNEYESWTTSKKLIAKYMKSEQFKYNAQMSKNSFLLYISNPINSKCLLNIFSFCNDLEVKKSIEYWNKFVTNNDYSLDFISKNTKVEIPTPLDNLVDYGMVEHEVVYKPNKSELTAVYMKDNDRKGVKKGSRWIKII